MRIFHAAGEYVEHDPHLGFELTRIEDDGVTFLVLDPEAGEYKSVIKLGYNERQQGVCRLFLHNGRYLAVQGSGKDEKNYFTFRSSVVNFPALPEHVGVTEPAEGEVTDADIPADEITVQAAVWAEERAQANSVSETKEEVAPPLTAVSLTPEQAKCAADRALALANGSNLELELEATKTMIVTKYDDRLGFAFNRFDDTGGVALFVTDPFAEQVVTIIVADLDDVSTRNAAVFTHAGREFILQGIEESDGIFDFRVAEADFPLDSSAPDCNCNR